MRGRIKFYCTHGANDNGAPFGWGFIVVEDGPDIYFAARNVCYSPIRGGDEVEFEIRDSGPVKEGRGLAARSVRRVEHDEQARS